MGKQIFILVMGLCFVSCEYIYDYRYFVSNSSSTTIEVKFKANLLDTTFHIEANTTKEIYSTIHGIEGAKGPYFASVSLDFQEIFISNADSLRSNKNYLEDASWEFLKGDYRTEVIESEFQ